MKLFSTQVGRIALASFVCWSGISAGHAGEFEKAYAAALENDAKFQAAKAALASGQQALPLARSSVLPSVNATISDTAVQGTQDYDVAGGASKSNNLDYRAPTQSISLRAPLLNLEGKARVRQANAQVGNAEATFVARKAELVDRLAVAYLQRMLAEDAFLSLHAQVHATVAQRNLMRRRFEQGEGTRTEVAEARANLSLTMAQWADSKDQMTNARETLNALTGLNQPFLVRLGDEFTPPPLVPATLQEWQEKAVAANPDVQARRFLVDAADALIARSNAGHMPRLDLVASVSNSRNESVSSLNQTVNQSAIGLQLNIPIYSGGAVKAAVTQAIAEKAKAEAEWLNEKRSLEVEVSRLFQVIQTGKSKLLAYEDVLDASRTALEGTLKGQASGLRTNADVLEAVRKVFQAQRDLAQARYDHIFQRLRLFNKAGVPADSVVSYIDELLSPQRDTP
ncbi:TolC family outer membrane protein [Rhodoferax mekongensis]|uniref:TolC family outer membrane protein n=1 Tax=Rhodoferax mekongensis TaxID=3068341 RepID=A0ABZ0AZ18_9BURK|nr:TolC family outer membrane protein [Rhodoferax sp. TBRC 17307]WNO04896.1 TolC family outer membrane protein [Rhodoferax sp. TBRC 17307]